MYFAFTVTLGLRPTGEVVLSVSVITIHWRGTNIEARIRYQEA